MFTGFVFCTLAFLIVIAFFLVSVCAVFVCLRRTGVSIDVIFSIPHSTSQPNEKAERKERQKRSTTFYHLNAVVCIFIFHVFFIFSLSFANSKSANSKLKLTIRSYVDICAVVKFQRFFVSVDVLLLFSAINISHLFGIFCLSLPSPLPLPLSLLPPLVSFVLVFLHSFDS